MVRRHCLPLLFISVIVPSVAQAQTTDVVVSGTVREQGTREGLPAVTVSVKGAAAGIVTAADGSYELSVTSPSDTLLFTHVGYETLEVPIEGRATIDVELAARIYTQEELVVIGYAQQRRGSVTGSVATVDFAEKSEGQPLTNGSQALYGISGLSVRLNNSYPGTARTTVNLRGVGTLSSDRTPLVLVDGVPYSMDELNPNDIESVTVLKDASAAIYGSRAANGVILVTTKGGTQGAQFSYSNYFGTQEPTTLPDAIWDSQEFLELKRRAILNTSGEVPASFDEDLAAYEQGMATDPLGFPSGNDWFDIAMSPAPIQKHDLSVSGGAGDYRYRLSLGYLDQQGLLFGSNNDAREYYVGVNTTAQLSERLEVGLKLHGTHRWYTRPPYNSSGNTNYMTRLMRALPIMPDLLDDGSYGQPSFRIDGRNNWEHPRMLAEVGYYKKYVQRFMTSMSARYELPLDLDYNVTLGADKYDGRLEYFIPRMEKKIAGTDQITYYNSETAAPRSYNADDNDLTITFHQTLDWQPQLGGAHAFSLLGGFSYENSETMRFNAQARGYLDGTLPALNAGTVPFAVGGTNTRDVLQSYFGRLNYSYKDTYLIDAVVRYDGSSRFAPGNRWGLFPSVSAGWRIDREPFFPTGDVIDQLKLRVSVGEMGNQAVPLYSYANLIDADQHYTFGGELAPGAAVTSSSDPNISWETTRVYNLGVDVNAWENRLNFSADVYKRRTRDILREVPIPSQVGNFSGATQNVGVVDNTGFELTAGYGATSGPLSYRLQANFNYNRNEVIDIGGNILYNHGTNLPTITREGYAMNSLYVYKSDGIFRDQAEVDAHVNADSEPLQPNAKPGWIRYVDVNSDGEINGDDRVIIEESSIMPKYTFGFDVNLGYRGWALDANFQGIAGMRYYQRGNIAFPFRNGANATREWLTDAWTPENPDARLPMVMESNRAEVADNFIESDFWLKDGSYLRLKNIQLSYTLSSTWLTARGIDGATVFVNAHNWLTLTTGGPHHIDVETATNKVSLYHYPMMKTASVGFSVNF